MNHLLAVNIGSELSNGRGGSIDSNFPSLSSLVNIILKNSLTIVGIILLILLISGGLMYIIGAGEQDQKKAAQGKAILIDAIIGFVVVLMAFFIVQIVEVVTGLKIFNSGL